MLLNNEISIMLDEYSKWLRDKTILKELSNAWVEITTPNLDRHNDFLQIYVKKNENKFILTDDGYILADLANSGLDMGKEKRKILLENTLRSYGVLLINDRLEIEASRDNFSEKKHNLLQAMINVNDMFFITNPAAMEFFINEVTKWFDVSGIRYVPNLLLTGKSGFNNKFDFTIPKSERAPERIIQTISKPSKDRAETLIFKWLDTKEEREPNSKLYAILNDSEIRDIKAVTDALETYDIKQIPWSRKQDSLNQLVA